MVVFQLAPRVWQGVCSCAGCGRSSMCVLEGGSESHEAYCTTSPWLLLVLAESWGQPTSHAAFAALSAAQAWHWGLAGRSCAYCKSQQRNALGGTHHGVPKKSEVLQMRKSFHTHRRTFLVCFFFFPPPQPPNPRLFLWQSDEPRHGFDSESGADMRRIDS